MERKPADSLEEQVFELRARMRRMEEALRRHGIVLDAEAGEPVSGQPVASAWAAPGAAAGTQTEGVPPVAVVAPDMVAMQESAEPGRSLESRIGSQWFNRVGILAVLIGVAWFLKLAFDNHWIGPLGRVLVGVAAGVGLIAWSERFRLRGFVAFSYSLKAIGSGVLYLSLWAAFSLYAILPGWAAFAAMIAVTAFNGLMAWKRDAELLALYAIAGGILTPLLVSRGGNHEVALFGYLLMLDVAVLALVAMRPWSRLLFAAFLSTAMFVCGWWASFYTPEQAGRTALFVAFFYLMFALGPRLARVRGERPEELSAWDSLALVVLPILNAGLGFAAFYGLLWGVGGHWAEPWLAVGFAAFYLMLFQLPERGILRGGPELLAGLHLSLAVLFLTIALPLETHGRWLTIGWLAEGGGLVWLASRVRLGLVQVLGLLCLALGTMALVVIEPRAATTPIWNERFGTYLVGIAVFALVAWLASKTKDEPEPPVRWRVVAGLAVLAMNALILLAVSLEIHSYWWRLHGESAMTARHAYRIYAQFSYSAFFMAFGAVLLATGFWRRSAFLRWQALVLLALTIAKVFVLDILQLSQGLKVLSFLGLGVLLLVVSFAYQRDWLSLRKTVD